MNLASHRKSRSDYDPTNPDNAIFGDKDAPIKSLRNGEWADMVRKKFDCILERLSTTNIKNACKTFRESKDMINFPALEVLNKHIATSYAHKCVDLSSVAKIIQAVQITLFEMKQNKLKCIAN